jgi:putative nucleotidyltransferase with HDIG domain
MASDDPNAVPSPEAPAVQPLGAEDEDNLAHLFERWQQLAEDEDILPPLSPLASRLLALDSDASAATTELTQIVESDPVLTGRILGLANSVVQSVSGKPIFEVVGAVIRLGVDAVFEAAFAQIAALWLRQNSQLLDKTQLHELWLEYLITAFCSRQIASRLDNEQVKPSLAYAAGLLHDVGTLALSCEQPGAVGRLARAGYAVGTPLYDKFVDAHTRLGAALLQRWGIPAELAEVAARHHEGFGPEESATSGIVFLADHLHKPVISHERAEFHRELNAPLGCFGGETNEINAALLALGLDRELHEIVERVASESARIEVLAAAVAS